jgi:Mobilization protein NikA
VTKKRGWTKGKPQTPSAKRSAGVKQSWLNRTQAKGKYTIRYTPEEDQTIEKHANFAGISKASWIRMASLGMMRPHEQKDISHGS